MEIGNSAQFSWRNLFLVVHFWNDRANRSTYRYMSWDFHLYVIAGCGLNATLKYSLITVGKLRSGLFHFAKATVHLWSATNSRMTDK